MHKPRLAHIVWLAGYLAVMGGLVACLVHLRGEAIADLERPEVLAQWQAWKAETQRLSRAGGPVSRRPVTSEEPPALVLLRDNFPAVVATSLLAASFLFGFLAFVARGSLAHKRRS